MRCVALEFELQLNDVHNLLESSHSADRLYIEKWIQDLDLKNVYEKGKK